MENFGPDKLIAAVKDRPAIWDIKTSDYNNIVKKKQAWDEIIHLVVPQWIAPEEKERIGADLMNKWKTLKDRYTSDVERRLKHGSKSSFIYARQLEFLKDLIEEKSARSSTSGSDDVPSVSSVQTQRESALKTQLNLSKKRVLELDKSSEIQSASLASTIVRIVDDDEHFLLSLLPFMKTVPMDFKISLRMELMHCVTKFAKAQSGTQLSLVVKHPDQVSSPKYRRIKKKIT